MSAAPTPLPASLRARSEREAIFEDIEPHLDSTIEERAAILESLYRAAADEVAAHPDRERIVAWQDPRSAEGEALWLSLVRGAAPVE